MQNKIGQIFTKIARFPIEMSDFTGNQLVQISGIKTHAFLIFWVPNYFVCYEMHASTKNQNEAISGNAYLDGIL